MARWTQKGVAWERVQGSGVRVGGVRGHSQLDSLQEEARMRKEGGRVSFSFSFSPFSSLVIFPTLEGDIQRVNTTGR